MILPILIKRGKGIFPWKNFVLESLFTRLNMVDIFSLKILRRPRFGLPNAFNAFSQVTYGTLDMCAFGMRDPNGYYYKPSLLHNFPDGTLNPVFKRCSNKSKKNPTHYHQPLEGSAPGYGSRTKLARVYPYRFCSTLIRSILPLGNPRALYLTQLSLAVDVLEDLNLDELQGVQNQLAALTASEHPVLATDLYEQGLPVRDYYTRRLLNRINYCSTIW